MTNWRQNERQKNLDQQDWKINRPINKSCISVKYNKESCLKSITVKNIKQI
jgi:hypothetical protein